MQIGEKIRTLRVDAGLSQQQLADVLFVSRAAIAKWENGNGMPDVDNLKALAGFFCCNLDILLDDNKDLHEEDEYNSYCGKDCSACTDKDESGCPGCLLGPGGQLRNRCEIAACCVHYRHSTCAGCTSFDNCERLTNREMMPSIRKKQKEAADQRARERKNRAKFLKKWLWTLLLLLIPRLLFNMISTGSAASGLLILQYVGEIGLILCIMTQGLVYLRISVVNNHFQYAGYYYLACGVVQLLSLLFTGGIIAVEIILMTAIPILLLQLFCLYKECHGYSEVVSDYDYELSEQWIKLLYVCGGSIVAVLVGLLLTLIMKRLALLLLIAASIGSLVSAVWMIILQYKTAKEISMFT